MTLYQVNNNTKTFTNEKGCRDDKQKRERTR